MMDYIAFGCIPKREKRGDEVLITHRCKGSLKEHVSIRYAYPYQWAHIHFPDEKQAWRMITYGVDVVYIETSNKEINFCPFCGQKLEAPKTERVEE